MALLVEYHDDAAVYKKKRNGSNKKKKNVDNDEWTQANGVRYI